MRTRAFRLGAWMIVALSAVAAGGTATGGDPPREEPVSVVDWLKARGQDSSPAARKALFERLFPGEPYEGTAPQNVKLLARLKAEGVPMAPATRVVEQQGVRVVLDLSPQVLSLELREDERTEYVNWGEKPKPARTVEPEVMPILPADAVKGFVPAAILAAKAKAFDDGMYAAVEVAVQGGPQGKAELLRRIRDRLAEAKAEGTGAEVVSAATVLGGVPGATPAHLQGAVKARIAAFDADEKRSKPLGFYTWSEALSRVFRQDRMLQSEIPPSEAGGMEAAFKADPEAFAAYGRILALYEGLTNPWEYPDFRKPVVAPTPVRFLPPSRSFESDLVKKHWGSRPVPEGASAFQLLIDEVRSGRVSLQPSETSGWYDRVAWSLDPLIRPESVPEAAKLSLGKRYRAYLEELFKGLLALARETHVKQLDIGPAGAAPPPPEIWVPLNLTVEPLATHYARRADAYAFVGEVLVKHFGREGLAPLRRLTAEGPVPTPLSDELTAMERLFRGAAETARAEIASPDASAAADAASDRERFASFRANLASDPDLAKDVRMMVPVFFDVERNRTKVWAFLGWTEQWLDVAYATAPRVVSKASTTGASVEHVQVRFAGQSARVLSPVVAEVYVNRLLDRAEFRAHCDRWKTRSAILANLR